MSRKKEVAAAALTVLLAGAGKFAATEADRAQQQKLICPDGTDPVRFRENSESGVHTADCHDGWEIKIQCEGGKKPEVDNSKLSFLAPVYKCVEPQNPKSRK